MCLPIGLGNFWKIGTGAFTNVINNSYISQHESVPDHCV